MSFILDALKKSEAERRQGEVPSLQNDFGSVAPRRRSLWPFLLVLALLLNGGVLGGWLLLRQENLPLTETSTREPGRILAAQPGLSAPAKAPAPPDSSSAVAQPSVPVAAAKPFSGPPIETVTSAVEGSSESQVAQVATSETVTKTSVPPAAAEDLSAFGEKTGSPEPPVQTQASPPQSVAERAGVVSPAPPPAESFPLLSELPADVRSDLPEMNLQLHFYSPDSARRLVRLNGFNLREGDRGGDGVNVVEITPEGIRLACRGIRFFLPTARR